MGNCAQRRSPAQEVHLPSVRKTGEGFEEAKATRSDNGKETSGLKIKVLLTKGELERLVLQLKENGGKRLEDVLEEIERGREKGRSRRPAVEGWKPSLESITETPEMQISAY